MAGTTTRYPQRRRGFRHGVTWLRRWWNDPVDYQWLLEFLDSRGVLGWLKGLVGAGGAAAAPIVVLLQFAHGGPHGTIGRAIDGAIVVGLIGWALRWWLGPWPSPRRSLQMIALGDVAITVACVQDADTLAGLAGTVVFVLTGAYTAYFHGPKIHAAHVGWAVLTLVGLAVRMGIDRGPAMAAVEALVFLPIIVGTSVLQFGYWLVQTNTVDSLVDPLTGLANRRAIDHHRDHYLKAATNDHPLCGIVIDVDGFKAINDRHGHLVGDQVLVDIAKRITTAARPSALVARLGGEEFVVIDHLAPHAAGSVAERIRAAIATSDDPAVTVSVGVATTCGRQPADGIDALLTSADTAMYTAKDRGGNTVVMH